MASELVILLSTAISAFATLIIALAAWIFSRAYLKEKSLSRYDDREHKAVLSEMRNSYETRIRDLTKSLVATEARWKDLNHLLISSQNAIGERQLRENVALTHFLKGLGINQNELTVDPKLVLVLMPFSARYDSVYQAIVSTCRRAGLNCVRGDEERASGDVLSHILRIMVKARLVVAEVTERNPNVYYELGIAHAMDKPTILIAQKLEGVPFDIQSTRILIYEDIEELRAPLAESLLRAVAVQ